MNLLWHQFKKDVKYTWPLLLLALAVFTLRLFNLSGIDFEWTDKITDFSNKDDVVLGYLQFFTVLVLITCLVHGESLTNSESFWMTRPISFRLLLQSKGLFIFIFLIILPIVLELGILALHHFTDRQLLWALAEMAIENISWIILIVLLASLTKNLGQFIVACIAIRIFLMLFRRFIEPYFMLHSTLLGNPWYSISLYQSQELVIFFIILMVGLGIIFHQYRTRNVLRSVIFCIILFFIKVAVDYIWPIDFFKPRFSNSQNYLADLTAKLNTNEIYVNNAPHIIDGHPAKSVSATIDFLNRDSSLEFEGITVDGRVTHEQKSYSSKTLGIMDLLPDPRRASIQYALGESVEIYQLLDSHYEYYLFDVPTPFYLEHKIRPCSVRSKFKFVVQRYRKIAELDLKPGVSWQRNSEKLKLNEIFQSNDSLEIRYTYQLPNLYFDPKRFNGSYAKGFYCVLLNQKTREAIWGKRQSTYISFLNSGGARLKRDNDYERFDCLDRKRKTRITPFRLDSAWLADAKLVLLEPYVVGGGEKEFQFENFIMEKQ